MLKKLLVALTLLTYFCTFSQVKGKVTDTNNLVIPYASIVIQDSYIGTGANEKGIYELGINTPGNYVFIFKSIGYKTLTKSVFITKFPFVLDVVLEEEANTLNEMVIVAKKEDPAYEIIRNTIAAKKSIQEKIKGFEVDFYSKGSFIIDSFPEKILFFDLKEEKKEFDSTQTKHIYLSETFSKLKFQKPNKYNEVVTASKVSGNDNGFSFNTALQSNVDFFNNTIKQIDYAVSPLSNQAFSYYKFKLLHTFLDENNQLINKIQVTPKNNTEPTFSGEIYIVENTWNIYAIDLKTTGKSLKKPMLDTFNIQQQFQYNAENKLWTKQSQAIQIKAGVFGINFTGNFIHIFNNYNINPEFTSNDFGKTIVTFTEKSNQRDSLFWEQNRPIPLTQNESFDYKYKDSVAVVKKFKADSLRIKSNVFKFKNILNGYSYKSKNNVHSFNFSDLIQIPGYNSVQGINLKNSLNYKYNDTINKNNFSAGVDFNYGFSEQKLRSIAFVHKTINYDKRQSIYVLGGSKLTQYNQNDPITDVVNAVSSLVFRKNFAKYYHKNFISAKFNSKITDFMSGSITLSHEQRKALQNHSNANPFDIDREYWSNNPLNRTNDALAFETNSIYKMRLNAFFEFGNQYIKRGRSISKISNTKYPTVHVTYTNALGTNDTDYHFETIEAQIKYSKKLAQYGNIQLQTTLTGFINKSADLLFIDYTHFNGNRTFVYNKNLNNNHFYLMPYYKYSTQENSITAHLAYNDKGIIINKIPLLKQLQCNLIGNVNFLSTTNSTPYIEYAFGLDNLGFGKYRLLKLQYTISNQNTKGIQLGMNLNLF